MAAPRVCFYILLGNDKKLWGGVFKKERKQEEGGEEQEGEEQEGEEGEGLTKQRKSQISR